MRKILLILVFLSMTTAGFCSQNAPISTTLEKLPEYIQNTTAMLLTKVGVPADAAAGFGNLLLFSLFFFVPILLCKKLASKFPGLGSTTPKQSHPFTPPQHSEPRRDTDAFTETELTDPVGTRLATYQETPYEIRLVSANGMFIAVYKKDDKRTYDCVGRLLGGGNQLARYIPITPFGGAR